MTIGIISPYKTVLRIMIESNTKILLYSTEFLRTEMTSEREYSSDISYSLFYLERSDVISVLKNAIEYTFVFFRYSVILIGSSFSIV